MGMAAAGAPPTPLPPLGKRPAPPLIPLARACPWCRAAAPAAPSPSACTRMGRQTAAAAGDDGHATRPGTRHRRSATLPLPTDDVTLRAHLDVQLVVLVKAVAAVLGRVHTGVDVRDERVAQVRAVGHAVFQDAPWRNADKRRKGGHWRWPSPATRERSPCAPPHSRHGDDAAARVPFPLQGRSRRAPPSRSSPTLKLTRTRGGHVRRRGPRGAGGARRRRRRLPRGKRVPVLGVAGLVLLPGGGRRPTARHDLLRAPQPRRGGAEVGPRRVPAHKRGLGLGAEQAQGKPRRSTTTHRFAEGREHHDGHLVDVVSVRQVLGADDARLRGHLRKRAHRGGGRPSLIWTRRVARAVPPPPDGAAAGCFMLALEG